MQRLLKVEGAIRKMQYVYKTILFLPLFIQALVCLSASKLSDCHLSEKNQLENVDRNCSCATGSLNTSSISELKVSREHPISYPTKEHYRRMKLRRKAGNVRTPQDREQLYSSRYFSSWLIYMKMMAIFIKRSDET